MNENVSETVREAIFTLIPGVPCLRELYMRWCILRTEEKALLDNRIASRLAPDRVQLYDPLKRALQHWDHLQNTQGAPGCESGLVSFSCQPQLESDLLNLIYAVHSLIGKMIEKREERLKKRTAPKKPVHEKYRKESPARDRSRSPVHPVRISLPTGRTRSLDRLSE